MEFQLVVLVESPLEEDGAYGYDGDNADLSEILKDLISKIWSCIETNIIYREKSAIAEVSFFYTCIITPG